MLIDTHAHINFNAYKDDADEVIRRSLDNNVWMLNVGSQYETSKRAVEMAQKYEKGVYASVGLHPIHLSTDLVKIKNDIEEIDTSTSSVSTLRAFDRAQSRAKAEQVEIKTKEENFSYDKYKGLAQNPKVVAIGEVGLDYYWKPKTKGKLELFKEKQRNVFCQQLNLANDLNLPVIFHCRAAHDDLLALLEDKKCNKSTGVDSLHRGVVHCFTGNWQQAEKYLEMGFFLGFNGIIFKLNLNEIIKKTPLDRILIETDCPYLTPPLAENDFLTKEGPAYAPPTSGLRRASKASAGKRNEPIYVRYVAEKIAEIKNISFERIAEITTRNAKDLFKI